jgi:hypothetical protein
MHNTCVVDRLLGNPPHPTSVNNVHIKNTQCNKQVDNWEQLNILHNVVKK